MSMVLENDKPQDVFLDIVRGDDEARKLTFKNPDGTPFDLTGSTIYFTARKNNAETDDTNAAIAIDVTSHTNPTGGITHIIMTSDPNDTKHNTCITPGQYYFDIAFKSPLQKKKTITKGILRVAQDSTKR